MAKLMGAPPKRLVENEMKGAKTVANIELLVEASADHAEEMEQNPTMSLLSRMTSVLENLTADKKHNEDPLEKALNLVSSGASSSDGTSGITGRSADQARRMLVRARTDPEKAAEMNNVILQRMMARFATKDQKPITSAENRTPIALEYLEHRANLSDYVPTAYWLWLLGGIVDAQIRDPELGLLHALLALAVGEQVSIDRGSWTLAWELSMQDERPPFPAMMARPASQHPGEIAITKLLDPRWVQVMQTHLQNVDKFQEARKRILTAHAKAPTVPKGPKGPGKGGKQKPENED